MLDLSSCHADVPRDLRDSFVKVLLTHAWRTTSLVFPVSSVMILTLQGVRRDIGATRVPRDTVGMERYVKVRNNI